MGLDSYHAARGRHRGLRTRLVALTASTALATVGLTALTALTDPAAAAAAGSSIYVADGGSATAIATATGSVTANVPTSSGGDIEGVAYSPDGNTVYATEMGVEDVPPMTGLLAVINAATNQVTSTISGVAWATAIAVAPGPKVSNVTPRLGTYRGGTTVTMTGSGFDGVTAVDFGGVPAASFTVNSSTSITAVSPPGPAEARVDLTVQTNAGVSAGGPVDQFTYIIVPTRPGPPVDAPIPLQGRE
jgi:DNA-binding beta-propeller fold protein YncE